MYLKFNLYTNICCIYIHISNIYISNNIYLIICKYLGKSFISNYIKLITVIYNYICSYIYNYFPGINYKYVRTLIINL